MSYTERDLTADFSRFLRKRPLFLPASCAIEYKISKTKTLNLAKALRPHQIPALRQVKHSALYHKISDMSPSSLPFDAFYLKNADAFLSVLFYRPRQPKRLYFLPVDAIDFSCRRLLEDEAERMAEFVVIF